MGQPLTGVTHRGELGVGERMPWGMVLSIVFVCCFVRHNGKSTSRGGTPPGGDTSQRSTIARAERVVLSS